MTASTAGTEIPGSGAHCAPPEAVRCRGATSSGALRHLPRKGKAWGTAGKLPALRLSFPVCHCKAARPWQSASAVRYFKFILKWQFENTTIIHLTVSQSSVFICKTVVPPLGVRILRLRCAPLRMTGAGCIPWRCLSEPLQEPARGADKQCLSLRTLNSEL